jgi:CHAT domain-containing protein
MIMLLAMVMLPSATISTQSSTKKIAETNYRNGLYHLEAGEYKTAKSYFQKAYDIYIELEEIFEAAQTKNRIGDANFGLKDYMRAYKDKLKALEVFSLMKEYQEIKPLLRDLCAKTFYLAQNMPNIKESRLQSIEQHLNGVSEMTGLYSGIYIISLTCFVNAYNLTLIGYDDIAGFIYDKASKLSSSWAYTVKDQPLLGAHRQNIIACIHNKGAIHEKNDQLEQAVSYYKSVIDLSLTTGIYNYLMTALDGLDTIYRTAGNPKNADIFYDYVISKLDEANVVLTTANIIYHFAEKRMKEDSSYNKVAGMFDRVLDVMGFTDYQNILPLNNAQKKVLAIKTLISSANNHIRVDKHQEALKKLDTAFRINEVFALDIDTYNIDNILADAFYAYAKTYTGMGELQEAEKNYIKAIALLRKEKNSLGMAEYFIDFARFEANKTKKYSLSAELYEKAMDYIKEAEENGEASLVILDEKKRLIGLEKAVVYSRIGKYEEALGELERIRDLFLKQNHFSASSKLEHIKYSLASYKMFSYYYKKLHKGESSFDFTEYARKYAFKENIYRNNILDGFSFNQSDKNLTNKLYHMLDRLAKEEISREEKLNINPDNALSLAVSNVYADDVFSTGEDGENLFSQFARIVNRFKKRDSIEDIFASNITSARDIRKHKFIPDDTAILVYNMSYSVHARPILFVIYEDRVRKYTELPRLNYSRLVKDYISALKDTSSNDYRNLSRKIYRYLVEPIADRLAKYKHLIIVPDGALNYIPFETLLTNEGKFLLEDFTITYSPSVTAYRKLIRKDKIKASRMIRQYPLFISGGETYAQSGAKPIYTGDTEERIDEYMNSFELQLEYFGNDAKIEHMLKDLNLKTEETTDNSNRILNLAGTFYTEGTSEYVDSVYTNGYGTEISLREKNSLKRLRNYLIVHFSTQMLNIEPFDSLLMFPEGDSDYSLTQNEFHMDGYLRCKDFFSLNLDADLVVLDQVEHVFGSILTGESMFNMVNTLIQTGTSHIMTGLWRTDRDVSDGIIQSVYDKVAGIYQDTNDIGYSDFLREAKLGLIKSGKHTHPYYWGNLVVYGVR